MIPTELKFTIDVSSFKYASTLHEFPWILVQQCSIMLLDDEWIKKYAMCLKKFKEKSERKIYGLDLDLRILIMVMHKQL